MAEKRVQELLGQMQKTLECSICLEMMTNPVSTGCGHQFCRFCLMEFLERKQQAPCPLCKKPITKRSLMKREQLGEMVEGVRSLITAFQKDTGALFSPPRGPQTSLLPGTPDAIQAKSAAGNKTSKTPVHGNVRRTKRKQHVDLEAADSPVLIESNESIPGTNLNSKGQLPVESNINLSKKETTEKDRRLELLRCIEEGTLNADEFVEDSCTVIEKEGTATSGMKAKSKGTSKKNSVKQDGKALVSGKCDKEVKINLTDCAKDDKVTKQSKEDTVSDNCVIKKDSVKFKNAESVENKFIVKTNVSSVNDCSGDSEDGNKMDIDQDGPVLSGASVAKESETSSGPLFKTPVDPKSLKHSKKGNDFPENCEAIPRRSLRSMDNERNNDQDEVDNDDNSSVKLTPEVLVVKDKSAGRTYCKKDKDLFVKEKKATKKVADWLKNIPSANSADAIDNKHEIIEVKERNQGKRLSKKNMKVMQEEEAMGSKIKHLAKQIQDNGQGLLFELDDFEGEDKSTLTDSTLRTDTEDTGKSLENDPQLFRENEFGNVVIEGNMGNCTDENDRITDTDHADAENNGNKGNQDRVGELSEDKGGVMINVVKEPVRKKRIFKSRTVNSAPSSESFIAKPRPIENIKSISAEKIKTKEEILENNSMFSNEIIQIESQESELHSSDPYEFKSSQNTPKKVSKKKGKHKKGKVTNKAKGKQKGTENKVYVIQTQNKTVEKKFEKMWNKNLMPDKTILKNRNTEEIDKMTASLQLAEEYDLLTCSQEAAESIAKEKEKNETIALDRINQETCSKGDFIQKKVRFTEPVISDFVQTGKIDIIGYRKAREEFSVENKETGDKKNTQGGESKSGPGKHKEKKHVNLNDGENPLGQKDKANEDAESDDLSEDYRFHDDSSGTDDLDIEPTQEQFEKPNFEIQPEEIKAQLSQELENVVQETPLIPVNKDSPNVNVIAETPAILSVAKFSKTLVRPIGKSSKQVQVKAVLDTPEVSLNKQYGNTKLVDDEILDRDTVKQGKHMSEKKPKVNDAADGIESFKHEKMKDDCNKLSAESDETKSPDVEVILVQEADKNRIKKHEQMEGDSDQEASQEVASSESALTQNSESLLKPHTHPAEILHTECKETDQNAVESKLNAGTEIQKGDELNFKNDRGSVTPERSLEKVKPKKKRKSFMLEETEESLEFGSLSECVVSVVEDSESVCKAKRQRVNRLRRSPKNKEKVLKETSEDTHKTDTVVKDIGENKESEASGSVEIIPDTMADSDSNVNPLVDNDGDKTGKDLANQEGTNVIRGEDVKKKTKLNKHLGEPNSNQSNSQVIDLSSESGSLYNLEVSENCKQKPQRRYKKKNSISDERESQQGKLDNSDKVDVIGETDITTIEDTCMSRSEMNEKFGNVKIKENYNMIPETFKSPNCLRSPEHRRKRKSGQSENDESSQHDIVRIRNLSGILDSPQDSLALSGVKGSPVDIFQIDTEMPSVDLSPDEGTLGLAHNSPSLDLGTLVSQESLVNDDNTQKRKSLDQSELTSHETVGNLINNSCEKTINMIKEKGQSDSLNLTPENAIDIDESKKDKKLDQDPDSSPEEKRSRSNVKAVRGFSKKKRQSDVGQSQVSESSSGNSIISTTPMALTSVKYKSPVAKFLSPKTANTIQSQKDEIREQSEQVDSEQIDRNLELDETNESPSGKKSKPKLVENIGAKQKQTNTPVKALKKTNISKYSPLLMKKKKEKEMKKEAEFEPEVVELKRYDDEEEDDCLLSPNDLPDLDIESVTVTKDREGAAQIDPDIEISNDEQVRNKPSRRSRISPKLFMNGVDKGNNVVLDDRNPSISDKIESECKTVIPETMSFDDDDDVDEEYNNVKCDKRSKGSRSIKDDQEGTRTEVTTTIDDENSMNSSSSSDFRLDSSDDESPEKQALTEISKFDQIVEHSEDLENSYVLQLRDKSTCRNSKVSNEKVRKKSKHASIESEPFEKGMTSEHRQTKDQDNYKNGIKEVVPVDSEDMYSTRLDSSPASCEEVNLNVDSEPVILESDLDDDASENDDSRVIGDKSVSRGTENKIAELESTEGNKGTAGDDDDDDNDDDEESDDAVVRRKGVKRAILSDSSEDEEEGSRHMNMTSSSAFSSQSENLTTQERFSLEKEVERMAKEMEAMKEQLRRSKELNQSKNSESKNTPKPVIVDNSDEDMIEANDSDDTAEEEDMFLSPPAITPGDLQMDDEETMDPAVVLEAENNVAAPGDLQMDDEETVDPALVEEAENDVAAPDETVEQADESLALPLESLTVPESDPSQLSRPVLADLDTNTAQLQTPNKKRQVGIVATGLNVQQLQQTKKLVALTDAKFFTKFNDSVTHVIVKPADEDETICDRTLKFFQGIARKCWIVNFFWVVDSRQVGHLLPEGPYEIQGDTANNEAHHGPKRARLSRDKLFKKFQFSLIGDNTFLSKDSMVDLIETCGGDIPNMANLGQGHRVPLVISCTDLDDEEEDVQFIVKHAKDLYKGLGVVTVTREWVLDSLTLYRIQPIQDYIVTDVPNIKLPPI